MADSRSKALEFAKQNRGRFLDELKELVAIPSISADSAHKSDIKRASEWLEAKLKALGFENVKSMDTGGHPIVYGDWMKAGAKAPTMLVYGHYDVQPPDPLELWESKPFEAVKKGDYLVGRGTSDMKGQVIASLAAVESALTAGEVPVNIKWMIEGEEEMGSGSMADFIRANSKTFASDFALNPDAGMLAADQPTLTYGLRGLAYFEIHLTGPDKDLHSGYYGGTVRNPGNELARLISGMHDEHNRVTLPGFYDSVRNLDDEERAEFKRVPHASDSDYIRAAGVTELWGEEGYTAFERATARPTLEVNGILCGYTGEGPKTVLPSKAMAKVSCRLVADQSPKQVEQQMMAYVKEHCHPAVKCEVKMISDGDPAISERDSRPMKAMDKALEAIWGKKAIYRREGGTISAVAYMQKILGAECVNTGFGLPDDLIHSPNEHMHLPTWEKGVDALIHFIYNLGET
ncbi:MAG TPA: dipeptidase [Anaerolineales bacterium]|nr:dipeptidase [Anaerolineales bacterium]